MTKTQHYQLNQWEPADGIDRKDFNSDNAAIDAALAAHDTALAAKAEQADLDAANTRLEAVAAANCWFKLFETTLAASGTVTISDIPTLIQEKMGAGKTLANVNRLVIQIEGKCGNYSNLCFAAQINDANNAVYYHNALTTAQGYARISGPSACTQMSRAEIGRIPLEINGVMFNYTGTASILTGESIGAGGLSVSSFSGAAVAGGCSFEEIRSLHILATNDVYYLNLDAGSHVVLYAVM